MALLPIDRGAIPVYLGHMDTPIQRPRAEWAVHSACSKPDVPAEVIKDFFYEAKGRPSSNPLWKQLCFTCVVRLECLNYAVVHKETGNWGGSTERERKQLPESFVEELTEISKRQGWYEVHPDPVAALQKYRNLTQAEQEALAATWELDQTELDPLEESRPIPQPTLTEEQQRSLALLGFY